MDNSKLFEKYHTSLNGLTAPQAKENEKFGKNILNQSKKPGFFARFFKQFANLMVMVLLVSAIVSTIVSLVSQEYGDLFESALIFVIVIANALIGVVQENKAEVALEEIKKLSSPKTTVVRDGKIQKIDSTEIVVGDLVQLNMGDNIAADIVLIETNNFKTNESLLTGESENILKDANFCSDDKMPLSERKNMCYAGTSATSGNARGIVVAVGGGTQMGKIADLLDAKPPKSPLEKNMEHVGKVITYGVLIVVAIVFFAQLLFSNEFNFMSSFLTAVALAVAAIPESLPAVITIVMALGVERLAKNGAIVKSLASVETLGSCTCIASDKTGTLTQNKMQVASVYTLDKTYSKTEFSVVPKTLIKAGFFCNNTKKDDSGNYIGDATETSIINFVKKHNLINKNLQYNRIYELPFDSTRKIMSVLIKQGGQNTQYTKGAIDFLLPKCTMVLDNGRERELVADDIVKIYRAHNNFAKKGQRVICVAYKNTNVLEESNLVFVGLFGIVDPPREEVKESILKCKAAGLKPIMITGDHPTTAFAIARELGIATHENQVITGADIDSIPAKNLPNSIKNCSVFARVSPEHKTKIIKALKKQGNIVGFTGDGLNDAPSIKQADIGVCMGSGTDVSKSAADLIISTDNYATIVLAVEQGRTIFNNIQKVLLFLLSTNMVEVLGIFVAAIIMPNNTFLLPSQILFVNLVTDSLPAFALGLEKTEIDIMQKPPRNPKSTIFSGIGWPILIQGFIQSFVVVIMYTVCLHSFGNEVASTMAFATICFMQIIHAINCKTLRSITKINFLSNKTFNISFIVQFALILAVCTISPLQTMFGLVALNFVQWLIVAICSLSIIPIVEICKYFSNHKFIFDKHKNKQKLSTKTAKTL